MNLHLRSRVPLCRARATRGGVEMGQREFCENRECVIPRDRFARDGYWYGLKFRRADACNFNSRAETYFDGETGKIPFLGMRCFRFRALLCDFFKHSRALKSCFY